MFSEEYPESAVLATEIESVELPEPEMLVGFNVGTMAESKELAVNDTVPENWSRLLTMIVADPPWPAWIVNDSGFDVRLKSGPMTWTETYA